MEATFEVKWKASEAIFKARWKTIEAEMRAQMFEEFRQEFLQGNMAPPHTRMLQYALLLYHIAL